MRKELLLFTIIFSFSLGAQEVEWAKKIDGLSFVRYFADSNKLCLVGIADGTTFNVNDHPYTCSSTFVTSYFAELNKNGGVSKVSHIAGDFMANDLAFSKSGFYFAGTATGANSFCLAKNASNLGAAWTNCYTSRPTYPQNSPYYPQDWATSVIEHAGSLYLTGIYQDSLVVGDQSLIGGVSLIGKFDPSNGHAIWLKNIPGGSGSMRMRKLDDGTFLIGSDVPAGCGCNFDGTYPQLTRGTFVTRVDTNGNFLWVKQIAERTLIKDMIVDANKNIYVAGQFNDSCRIGSAPFVGRNGGIFILKSDSVGNIQWSKVFFNKLQYGCDYPSSIALDRWDNVLVTGCFCSSDTLDMQDTVLTNPNDITTFFVKYSSSGQFKYAMNLPVASQGFDVSTDDEGAAYLVGRYYGQMTIGNYTLASAPQGQSANYLIKIKGESQVGINTQAWRQAPVKIFPNPSSGVFSIQTGELKESAKLFIRDLFGNCVFKDQFQSAGTKEIDLRSSPRGIYFLEFVTENNKTVKKIAID